MSARNEQMDLKVEDTRPAESGASRLAARFSSARSLSKKAYLNSLAAGVEYAARFAVSFLVTPFLIGGLGDALYGVWVVILKMTDYLSAGARSSQALKWFVVSRQSSDDFDEKRRGVGGAVAAWTVFLPLQAVIGGVIAWYLPIWLELAPELHAVVRAAAMLIVTSLVLRGFVDVPLSVLIGENLGYTRIWVSAPLVGVGGGLTILALHNGLGLIGVAACTLTTIVLTGLVLTVVVKWNVRWFGIALPDRATVRKFVGLSWWFTLWEFVIRVMMASDVVILGIMASPEVVAVYAIMRFLPEGVLKFLTVLVFETIPGIGKVFAAGEISRAAKMRGEVMLLAWLATTSVGVTLLLWNQSFVELWVGSKYAVDPLGILLIVVMVFQFVWIRADADFINLTLDLRRKVTLGAVSTAVSLALSAYLVNVLENPIVGLCLGFIIGRSILSVGYPLMIGQVLKVPFGRQLSVVMRPAIVTLAMFCGAALASTHVEVQSWISLIFFGAASFALIALLVYGLGMNAANREIVLMRLQQLTRRAGVR